MSTDSYFKHLVFDAFQRGRTAEETLRDLRRIYGRNAVTNTTVQTFYEQIESGDTQFAGIPRRRTKTTRDFSSEIYVYILTFFDRKFLECRLRPVCRYFNALIQCHFRKWPLLVHDKWTFDFRYNHCKYTVRRSSNFYSRVLTYVDRKKCDDDDNPTADQYEEYNEEDSDSAGDWDDNQANYDADELDNELEDESDDESEAMDEDDDAEDEDEFEDEDEDEDADGLDNELEDDDDIDEFMDEAEDEAEDKDEDEENDKKWNEIPEYCTARVIKIELRFCGTPKRSPTYMYAAIASRVASFTQVKFNVRSLHKFDVWNRNWGKQIAIFNGIYWRRRSLYQALPSLAVSRCSSLIADGAILFPKSHKSPAIADLRRLILEGSHPKFMHFYISKHHFPKLNTVRQSLTDDLITTFKTDGRSRPFTLIFTSSLWSKQTDIRPMIYVNRRIGEKLIVKVTAYPDEDYHKLKNFVVQRRPMDDLKGVKLTSTTKIRPTWLVHI